MIFIEGHHEEHALSVRHRIEVNVMNDHVGKRVDEALRVRNLQCYGDEVFRL